MIHGLAGYEALVLGFIGSGGSDAAEAMLIIGFLVYTVAVIIMALSKFGELGGKPIDIATIVMVLFAGKSCSVQSNTATLKFNHSL